MLRCKEGKSEIEKKEKKNKIRNKYLPQRKVLYVSIPGSEVLSVY